MKAISEQFETLQYTGNSNAESPRKSVCARGSHGHYSLHIKEGTRTNSERAQTYVAITNYCYRSTFKKTPAPRFFVFFVVDQFTYQNPRSEAGNEMIRFLLNIIARWGQQFHSLSSTLELTAIYPESLISCADILILPRTNIFPVSNQPNVHVKIHWK